MRAWLELHIEQARSLEVTGQHVGIVEAIAGLVHADVTIEGRADHAGGTAMDSRSDPLVTAGEVITKVESLTRALSHDAVGTVGAVEVNPGLINVIPASVSFTLDLRSASGQHLEVLDEVLAYMNERVALRGQTLQYRERTRIAPTPLDQDVVDVLVGLASADGLARLLEEGV